MTLEPMVATEAKEEQPPVEGGTTPRVPEANAGQAEHPVMRTRAEVESGMLARPTNRFDHSGREMPVDSPQGS